MYQAAASAPNSRNCSVSSSVGMKFFVLLPFLTQDLGKYGSHIRVHVPGISEKTMGTAQRVDSMVLLLVLLLRIPTVS